MSALAVHSADEALLVAALAELDLALDASDHSLEGACGPEWRTARKRARKRARVRIPMISAQARGSYSRTRSRRCPKTPTARWVQSQCQLLAR